VIHPGEINYVTVSVDIPMNYYGDSELNPILYAMKMDEADGQVTINIQMKKKISLVFGQDDKPNPEVDKLCSKGLQPIMKKSNGKMACVKPTSIEPLIKRGWGAIIQ